MKNRVDYLLKVTTAILIISCMFCIPLLSSASELIYTIQAGSFQNFEDAKREYDSLVEKSDRKGLDYLRIEKIGDYHSVRIGKFKDQGSAEAYLKNNFFQIAKPLIRTAYIKDERIKEMYSVPSLLGKERLYLDTSDEKGQDVAHKNGTMQRESVQAPAVSEKVDENIPAASVSHNEARMPDSASELIYTIQTGSFKTEEEARKQYSSIVNNASSNKLAYLRIEKIGNYYSVRTGKFDDQVAAREYLRQNDLSIAEPIVRTAYIKNERVVEMYAAPGPAAGHIQETVATTDAAEPVVRKEPEDTTKPLYYSALSQSVNDQDEGAQVLTDSAPEENMPLDNQILSNALEDAIHGMVPSPTDTVIAGKALETEEAMKDEKSVAEAEEKQYAVVFPGDDKADTDQEGAADSVSDSSEVPGTEIPVNTTGDTLHAAGDTIAEQKDTGHETHFAENTRNDTGVMDDHELWEELGLDHVEEGAAVSYHFAEITPQTEIAVGYRLGGTDGMDRAFEYEDVKNFPMVFGDYEAFHYPNKYHFDLTMNTENDYMLDVRYGYESMFNAQLFNTTFIHNLDDIDLIDLDATESLYRVSINDDDDKFWVRNGINHVSLKYKNPSYHGHAFYKGLFVSKKGSQQQRSLAGSGYFSGMERLSRNRNVDQMTMQDTLGFNGHLGPGEFEFTHTEKIFTADKDKVLYDDYALVAGRRPAGNFPHNQLPELKSSSNTFKIHTSYTGKLVAAATFSMKEKRNKTSGANEDIFVGEGSVRWMPLLRLSLYLNYAHREVEAENPSVTSITDSAGSTTTYSTAVKPAVNTSTDVLSLTARYRPEKGLTLRGKYTYEHIARDDVGPWNLKDSTRKNGLALSADAKIMKGMKLKLNYSHRSVDKPSYNTEAYNSNRGMASMTWNPVRNVNLLLSYSIERAERNELGFSETDGAKDRDVKTDNILASGTFQIRQNLSLTASHTYMRYKVKQDIVYEDLGSSETVESGIPFTSTAHVYSGSVYYMPIKTLDIHGQITHTRTDGEFEPKSENLQSPISIASFSRHKVRRTLYRLTGNYACPNKFTCSLDLQYGEVDDSLDNVYDNVEDADAYIILFKLMRKWG